MSHEQAVDDLTTGLVQVLWAIHVHRAGDDLDERGFDIAEVVSSTVEQLHDMGVEYVVDVLDHLEFACLNIAGVWWTPVVNELAEEIEHHLGDRPSE